MIHSNIKYGNTENVTVVEHGCGTIVMNSSEGEDHHAINIKTAPYRGEVGAELPNEAVKGETIDLFKPEVVLVFRTLEGLEVLQDYINHVRNQFKRTGNFT